MSHLANREVDRRLARRAAVVGGRTEPGARFDIWRLARDGGWTRVWEFGRRRARAARFAVELTEKYGVDHVVVPAGRRPERQPGRTGNSR
jgi:hypothetical protein